MNNYKAWHGASVQKLATESYREKLFFIYLEIRDYFSEKKAGKPAEGVWIRMS